VPYEDPIQRAIRVLKRYPLCDRCLGRLFAELGRGLDNAERGRVLKIAALMTVHDRVRRGLSSPEELKLLCRNLGAEYREICRALSVDVEPNTRCYICGGDIESWIGRYTSAISEVIKSEGVSTFLVGVRPPREVVRREREVVEEMGIDTWESVKSELKRVIGKAVRSITGAEPDFEHPEAIFVIDMERGAVHVERPALLLLAVYWKLGRRISQMPWYTRNGARRYPLSLYDACKAAADLLGSSDVVIHAAGREDVDVRMLGSGRPLVIEFREPRRKVPLSEIERVLNSYTRWLRFRVLMGVRRDVVRRVKESGRTSYKIYRAVVVTGREVSTRDMEELEAVFKDRLVTQRTPLRILRRKKDVVRVRRVYEVKARVLAPHVFTALIKCEGGLYVKELVDGDKGRTMPSFAEVLDTDARCVELDVLYVHKQL